MEFFFRKYNRNRMISSHINFLTTNAGMLFYVFLIIGLIANWALNFCCGCSGRGWGNVRQQLVVTNGHNFRNVLGSAFTIGRMDFNHMFFKRTTTQWALNELHLMSFIDAIRLSSSVVSWTRPRWMATISLRRLDSDVILRACRRTDTSWPSSGTLSGWGIIRTSTCTWKPHDKHENESSDWQTRLSYLPAFRRLEVGVEGVGGLALLFVLVVESGTEDAPSGWPRASDVVEVGGAWDGGGADLVLGGTLAVGLLGSVLGVRNLISRRTLPSPSMTVRVIWIVLPFPVENVVVWLLRTPSRSSKRPPAAPTREKNGSDLNEKGIKCNEKVDKVSHAILPKWIDSSMLLMDLVMVIMQTKVVKGRKRIARAKKAPK